MGINRKALFGNEKLTLQGHTSDKELIDMIMINMYINYETMRRGSTKEVDIPKELNAELNFDYKQPIPYMVIKRGNQFYVTQRLEGGGVECIHGMLSMGNGGHFNAMGIKILLQLKKYSK